MRKVFSFLVAILFLFSACAPAATTPVEATATATASAATAATAATTAAAAAVTQGGEPAGKTTTAAQGANTAAQPTSAAQGATVAQGATAAQAADSGGANADYPLLTDPNLNPPGVLPVAKELTQLSVGLAQSTFVTSYAYEDNYLTRYFQDRTNVELVFELFPSTDAPQKLELMVSSGATLPDVMHGMGLNNDVVRYKYGQAGAIIPLDEYYEQLGSEIRAGAAKVGPPDTYENGYKYCVSPDGHIYGLITWSRDMPNHYARRAWWNMTFLEALGRDIPKTQAEFVETLRDIRDKDPNGNGRNDEIPMVGSTNGWNGDVILWLMNQYTYVDGGEDRFMLIEDGKLDYAYDKEEWREGLRFAKSLVDEGLLSTLSFTQDQTQYNALVSSEDMVVGLGVSGSVGGFGNNIQYHEGSEAIEGPQGVRYATYFQLLPEALYVITKDCANPALAFLFGTSEYTDDLYPLINRYGEPDVDWAYVTATDNAVGLYDAAGIPALFRQINQLWNTPQQQHWTGSIMPIFSRYEISNGMIFDGNENGNEYKNAKTVARIKPYTPDISKIFAKNIYTTAEIEQTAERRTALREYVKEAYTLFTMGSLSLDNDWDRYLNELNNLGYKELLAIDQAAYDRTQGN